MTVANLVSQTARSSVRLIKQALADMRAASSDLSSGANIQEVSRSADVLSNSIKRLSSYVGDVSENNELPRQRESIDIERISRIIEAAVKGENCQKCGRFRP